MIYRAVAALTVACAVLATAALPLRADDTTPASTSDMAPAGMRPLGTPIERSRLEPPRHPHAVQPEDPAGDGSSGRRADVAPSVYLDVPPVSPPLTAPPSAVFEQIGACHKAGVRYFADCLRHRHGVMEIRRLEACVGSDQIPDRSEQVRACLAAGQW